MNRLRRLLIFAWLSVTSQGASRAQAFEPLLSRAALPTVHPPAVLTRSPQASAEDPIGAGRSFGSRFTASEFIEKTRSLPSRLRAVRRLESLRTDGSTRELVRLASHAEELDTQELVLLARAFLARADDSRVLKALLRIDQALDSKADEPPTPPQRELVRALVAHALARNGTPGAIEPLSRMLDRKVDAARAAAALRRYPPADASSLLGKDPSAERIALLADLQLQSAVPALVRWTREGSIAERAASARALLKLAPTGTVPLARFWLTHEGLPTLLLEASTDILLHAGQPDAYDALFQLYDQAPEAARALAQTYHGPRLMAGLARKLEPSRAFADAPDRWFPVLASSDCRACAELLVRWLGHAEHGVAAAYALASMDSPEGRKALNRAQSAQDAATRDNSALGIVLDDILGNKRASSKPAVATPELRRWLLQFARAASDEAAALKALAGSDALASHAAAATATRHSAQFFEQVGTLIGRAATADEGPLAIALLHPRGRDAISTQTLARWLDGDPPFRPLAARALAERRDLTQASTVTAFLSHADPVYRAQVALGLGRSADLRAPTYLLRAYEFETDREVRLAIVRAVRWQLARLKPSDGGDPRSRHLERWLGSVAELDTDPAVRAETHAHDPSADDGAWLGHGAALRLLSPDALPEQASLLFPGLMPFPLGPTPWGWLVALAAESDQVRVRLESPSPHGEGADRGASQEQKAR